MAVEERDSLVDELFDLCGDYDTQSQALRNRIVELMVLADHQVSARVDLAFEVQRLAADAVELRQRLHVIEDQLHRTEAALQAIENTRLMRALRPLRAVYARWRNRS